jgi:type I restriction enzyme S subunit
MNKATGVKAEWPLRKVTEIAQHSLGKMLDKAKNKGEPQRYLRNINVRWFGFDLSDLLEMRFLPQEAAKYTAMKGDLLICEGGYPGRAAIWDQDYPIYFQKALHRVRFHRPEHNKWFLYYLHALDLAGTLRSHFNGSGIQHFTGEALSRFELPLAPLPEQQRIVGVLDEAFDGIAKAKANAEKNLQGARALFASYLQAVFTQRGEGWTETTVDKFSTNLDSKRVPITKSNRITGEYPYYGASGIVDYVADYILEGDALLISEDGANLLTRSTPIAFSVSGKYWVNNHAHILKFENIVTQRLVEFCLENTKLDDYITGTAQPKLNQRALNSIPIPIPKSIRAQAAVVGNLESFSAETERLESIYRKKLAALDELKKSLLHQAFTGQL